MPSSDSRAWLPCTPFVRCAKSCLNGIRRKVCFSPQPGDLHFVIQWGPALTSCLYSYAARFFFFLNVFRNALIIVLLTIVSWLYCSRVGAQDGKYPIKILQGVPRGFRALRLPTVDTKLVSAVAPEIPVATIILFLEHIAISKCMHSIHGADFICTPYS